MLLQKIFMMVFPFESCLRNNMKKLKIIVHFFRLLFKWAIEYVCTVLIVLFEKIQKKSRLGGIKRRGKSKIKKETKRSQEKYIYFSIIRYSLNKTKRIQQETRRRCSANSQAQWQELKLQQAELNVNKIQIIKLYSFTNSTI